MIHTERAISFPRSCELLKWNRHEEATIPSDHKIFCDEVVNRLDRATVDIDKGSILPVFKIYTDGNLEKKIKM